METKETKKEAGLAPSRRDPFALMRQMTSELERVFDESSWPSLKWPSALRRGAGADDEYEGDRPCGSIPEENRRLGVRRAAQGDVRRHPGAGSQ